MALQLRGRIENGWLKEGVGRRVETQAISDHFITKDIAAKNVSTYAKSHKFFLSFFFSAVLSESRRGKKKKGEY